MARLELVAQKAIALEEKVKQQPVGNSNTGEESEVVTGERSQFLEQISSIQSEVLELKKRRAEDAKANEKVVSIFASREQAWKAERIKSRNEHRRLWQELQRARQKAQCTRIVEGDACEDCEQRQALIVELRERLGEQEFLIMATMEEAKAEQQEKNALAGKLAIVDGVVTELREKIAYAVEEREQAIAHAVEKHEASVVELKAQQSWLEQKSSQAFEDLKAAQSEICRLTAERKRYDELFGRLTSELNKLEEEVRDKDELISAMLKKTNANAEERHELERELAVTKAKHMHAEREKETWKRLVEEKTRSGARKGVSFRPRSSFGSRTESGLDTTVELQRLHDDEIKNLQSIFEEQLKIMQKRANFYRERAADLEENVFLHMADTKRAICLSNAEGLEKMHCVELVDSQDMDILKKPMEAELAVKQFQLSVAKTLLRQYMDSDTHREQELNKWRKLYFASKATIEMLHVENEHADAAVRNTRRQDWLELEKARYASKLELRHWQEIDAFERQIKARDERMEAFRWQLLTMEDEARTRLREIEALSESLATATADKIKLQELLKEKEDELGTYRDQTLSMHKMHATGEGYEREIEEILCQETSMLQKMQTELEIEKESTLTMLSVEAESEIKYRPCRLAAVETQLVVGKNINERERKEINRMSLEMLKEKSSLECFLRSTSWSETERGVQDAIYTACLAMGSLSRKITEALMRVSHTHGRDGELVKELVDHVPNYDSKLILLAVGDDNDDKGDQKVLQGESIEQLGYPPEAHDTKDEQTVDKFVSVIEPDWLA